MYKAMSWEDGKLGRTLCPVWHVFLKYDFVMEDMVNISLHTFLKLMFQEAFSMYYIIIVSFSLHKCTL